MVSATESDQSWFDEDDALLAIARQVTDSEGDGLPEVPGYVLDRLLARGGQGEIYVARSGRDGTLAAVKVLRSDRALDPVDRARFEREIDVARRLEHPGIAPVLDHGRLEDGRLFLVMPLVEGVRFDAWAAATRDDAVTARVVRDLAQTVHAAHRLGVIHRDLKPSNVLVRNGDEPVILDFGLARTAPNGADAPWSGATVTGSGEFIGSLAWASPEQASGTEVDVRSDVYALGLMLYHALTGELPYPTDGALRDVLNHVATTPARTPSSTDRRIDADLETITLTALAKDPDARYESAGALAADLDAHLRGEPIAARRASAVHRAQQQLQRYRLAALTALLALLVVSTLAVTAIRARRDADDALARSRAALNDAQRETRTARTAVGFMASVIRDLDPYRRGESLRTEDLLDRIAQRVIVDLRSQPAAQSIIAQHLGEAYVDGGMYEKGGPMLDLVIQRRRAELAAAKSDAERRDAEFFLGDVLSSAATGAHGRWELETSRALFGEAIALLRASGPRGWFELSHTLVQHARVCGALQDHAAGLATLDEADALFAQRPDHELELQALDVRARLLQIAGRLDDAVAVYETARDRADAEDHTSGMARAAPRQGLASLYIDRGEPERGLPLAEAARAIWVETYDDRHRLVGVCDQYIGQALLALRRLDEAEAALDHALEVHQETHGRDSAYLVNVLAYHGRAKWAVGKPADALASLDRARQLQRGVVAARPAQPGGSRLLVELELETAQALSMLDRDAEAAACVDAAEALCDDHEVHDEARLRDLITRARAVMAEADASGAASRTPDSSDSSSGAADSRTTDSTASPGPA